MIAVDTNILVYAHRRDSPWNDRAHAALLRLGEHRALWSIPWPCVYEFLAIVTHPKIYTDPTPLPKALDQIDAWSGAGNLRLLAEETSTWRVARELLNAAKVTGPRMHDAKIAAICLSQGVAELWTADRDFSRFGHLRTRNPLVAAS